jgi:hypothetical protein
VSLCGTQRPFSRGVMKPIAWPAFAATLLVAVVVAIRPAHAVGDGLQVDGKHVRCVGTDQKACPLHVEGYPSYNLLLPPGWTVGPYEAPKGSTAIELSLASAKVFLWIMPGVKQPGPGLVSIRSQLEHQYKNFSEVDSGQTTLGGRRAAFGVYTGIPPAGGKADTRKVVVMTDGKNTFCLFLNAPSDEFATAKRAFDRIQSSFTLLQSEPSHGASEAPR